MKKHQALSLMLALILLASLSAGSAAAAPTQPGRALVAVYLDAPGRLAQAQAAGLQPYSQISTGRGEVLLAGAAPGQAGKAGIPLHLLDEDTTGASYYLAYSAGRSISWPGYGRVVLDLGDQVLLRADPAKAEKLLDLGVKIARISLEPQPWPADLSQAQADGAASLLAVTPDPNVQEMLSKVSTDTIYTYTAQLSGVQAATIGGAPYTITRRYSYSGTPIQKATQLATEHLQALGLYVENQVWGTSGTPSTYPNTIGQITGSTNPNDIYIIGAHIDDMPSSGNAPGADDNASGSVGTLIAADILSQYQWSCTLRFALWTGEEQGLYGSAAYATRAKNQAQTIKGYLNMDMISYNSGAPNEINLFSKSSVPGSVEMMNLYADTISAYGINLVPVKYPDDVMGNYSDNKSFWDKGYASIMAIEDYYGDETPYYHTASDTLSTVDMAYYTEFVKASLATFVHLSGCLITGTTPTAPAAPANLVATAASTSQINLTWTDSDSTENGFKIERCTGTDCSGTGAAFAQIAIVAANVTSYANTGLAASTSYSYRVRAFNGIGNSDYSNTASVSTQALPTPPAAPTGLTATAISTSQINLSWTDNAANETGFYVERCTGASCSSFTQIASLGANVTSYSNTGLSASTSYSYRVRAYNTGGNSGYSNTASATTQAAPTVPAAPTNLIATAASKSQINLTWTDNATNETGFKIERCKGSTCTNFAQIATVGANVTSYSSTGLSSNTTYRFRVRAYNATGNSSYSNIAAATTPRR
jgi:hypothetical protein